MASSRRPCNSKKPQVAIMVAAQDDPPWNRAKCSKSRLISRLGPCNSHNAQHQNRLKRTFYLGPSNARRRRAWVRTPGVEDEMGFVGVEKSFRRVILSGGVKVSLYLFYGDLSMSHSVDFGRYQHFSYTFYCVVHRKFWMTFLSKPALSLFYL